MRKPVTFYSEGVKLDGDLFLPEGLKPDELRAGVVLCHGYTSVKDLYLPDNARVLNEAKNKRLSRKTPANCHDKR